MIFDHIAVSSETLDEGVAWVEERLGVPMGPGGVHQGFGTHNRLLALGDVYLEVIAPDPSQGEPRWFKPFGGPPRLAHWLCRVDQLKTPYPVVDVARGPLRWRIAVPEGGVLPGGGVEPSLLQWVEGHALDLLPVTEYRLKSLRVQSAEPLGLSLDDKRVSFSIGAPRLEAEIVTPGGVKVLSA